MYIEKHTICYVNRKNIRGLFDTKRLEGRYHRKIHPIYDAAERQFLLWISRARVHRDGKNCRVSAEEAQILFRHRRWQSRDAEVLFVFELHCVGKQVRTTPVGCTNRQVVARGRGLRRGPHIRNDGIIKAQNPGDDENVNFDSRGPSGRVSALGDSLPIEDAFYIPLYRSFAINWAVKNRRDPRNRADTAGARFSPSFPPKLISGLLRGLLLFKLKFVCRAKYIHNSADKTLWLRLNVKLIKIDLYWKIAFKN